MQSSGLDKPLRLMYLFTECTGVICSIILFRARIDRFCNKLEEMEEMEEMYFSMSIDSCSTDPCVRLVFFANAHSASESQTPD